MEETKHESPNEYETNMPRKRIKEEIKAWVRGEFESKVKPKW